MSTSFRYYLRENIIQHITPKALSINTDSENLDEVIENYTQLLEKYPTDIACIGIGENGHLAFNDPGVADFSDQKSVKIVALDEDCRKQQYDEGWFESIDFVPKTALLTIPTIMSAQHISCFVPEERKANAVKNAPRERLLSHVLHRLRHPSVELYLDPPSAMLLEQ